MPNFSKTNWLIIFLSFSLVIASFFVYQWRQGKKELASQTHEREILLKQLSEIKKQSNFVQCRKLNVKKDGLPFPVYLLNSFVPAEFGPAGKEKEERHLWDFTITNPFGFGAGIGMTYESGAIAGISEEMPTDINEDGKMDREIVVGNDRKIGDYLIAVFSQEDILPIDTYGLQLGDLVLAKNIPYSSNQLDHIYILRQTEDGIIPIVPNSVGCRF